MDSAHAYLGFQDDTSAPWGDLMHATGSSTTLSASLWLEDETNDAISGWGGTFGMALISTTGAASADGVFLGAMSSDTTNASGVVGGAVEGAFARVDDAPLLAERARPTAGSGEPPAKRVKRAAPASVDSEASEAIPASEFAPAGRATVEITGAEVPPSATLLVQNATVFLDAAAIATELVDRAEAFAAGSPVAEEHLEDRSPYFSDLFPAATAPRAYRMPTSRDMPSAASVSDTVQAVLNPEMNAVGSAYMVTRALGDLDSDLRFHAYAEMRALWTGKTAPSAFELAKSFKDPNARAAVLKVCSARTILCAAPRCSVHARNTGGSRRLRDTRRVDADGHEHVYVKWAETCGHTRWHAECLHAEIETAGGVTPCPYCPTDASAVMRVRGASVDHPKCFTLAEVHACDECRERAVVV